MSVFLPIVPNWQNGVRDTYEFKTDVFTARDGSEQRRSQRMRARRSITAAVLLDGERQRKFADALARARDGKVLIADFSSDAAITAETAMIGDTVLKVDRLPAWIAAGSMDCALMSGRKAQRVSVDFTAGNQVVLTAPLDEAVGHGAQLRPLVPASLGTSNTLSVYTNLISTSSLTLDVEPGIVTRVADPLPFNGSPESETTQVFGPAGLFYGRYALLRKPNYLQRPQIAFNIPFQTVDYSRGVTRTFSPVPIVSRTLTATYLGVSHANVMSLLDVFIRCRGRSGEIFVPTWGHDLPPIKQISGPLLTVEGTEFLETYENDRAHNVILLRTNDGQLLPREIRAMSRIGSDTRIECDRAIGVSAAAVSHASWMFTSRFAQDSLTIEWRTNGVANLALSFVTLANLAAEDAFGSNWILATGYWRDTGQWQDTSVWND